MKKYFARYAIATALAGIASYSNAAGILVFNPVQEARQLLEFTQTVTQWQEELRAMDSQYSELQSQTSQMQQTYNSMNGSRGMASLGQTDRNYLPSTLQGLQGGQAGLGTSANHYKDLAKILDIGTTGLSATSDAGRTFVGAQNQNALNQAASEQIYSQASNRFNALQVLMEKVNQAPQQKDVQDLQARLQAEQMMLQNDQAKLVALSQSQQSQRDVLDQQSREVIMKSATGELPEGW
ncbi:hypothetical protein OO256_26595 [Pseudomonas sp. DCB_CB]|uniref:type IV secretion system protein n=1 Tax=unclassified Pseudomonas TaxID=196821 RepID=UPI0022487C35|nr:MULTISPECIES: type IV secretion system protein [unclassified Pseudomonas]MCX2694516.1 hypothetical protein [Pseudomonas sp. DCB_BZ]MCX2859654.1 hypothetical protein [Pseudomonas sp. DCB_CB]